MILDISIILGYFTVIMGIGVRARVRKDVPAEEYFLSSRKTGSQLNELWILCTTFTGHTILKCGYASHRNRKTTYRVAQRSAETLCLCGSASDCGAGYRPGRHDH